MVSCPRADSNPRRHQLAAALQAYILTIVPNPCSGGSRGGGGLSPKGPPPSGTQLIKFKIVLAPPLIHSAGCIDNVIWGYLLHVLFSQDQTPFIQVLQRKKDRCGEYITLPHGHRTATAPPPHRHRTATPLPPPHSPHPITTTQATCIIPSIINYQLPKVIFQKKN